jgi:transcriptional regulator with XRE-family HTH domain
MLGAKIKKLREGSGLSQEALAKEIGVSRVTLSQIENGERKLTPGELTTLSDLFNTSIDELLDKKKGPEVVLEKIKSTEKNKKSAGNDVRISVPQKNIKKFKEVLLYILNRVGSKPNVGETVIYKLLYFIDFDYYEKYEEQLIGARYQKNHYGPTPVEFRKIVDQMIARKELVKVNSEYFSYPQTKYLPLRKPDTGILKGPEIEMIDKVLGRLSDLSAGKISDYSHNDVPWQVSEEGCK